MPKNITSEFKQKTWREHLDAIPSDNLAEVRGGWAFGGTEQQRGGHTLGRNVRVVPAGGSIQNAIDELNSLGGGIVQLLDGTHTVPSNLTIYSNISLIGGGRGTTILEFSGGARGIQAIGTSSSVKTNMKLADFTLQNSNNVAGIDIDYFDFWRMENVRVTSCDQIGLRIDHSQNWLADNVRSDNNTGNGWSIISDATRSTKDFTINNCLSDTNGGIGYSTNIASLIGSDGANNGNFIGCTASGNTGDGFDLNGVGGQHLLSCFSQNNGGIGFDSTATSLEYFSCVAFSNTGDGFEVGGAASKIIGCQSSSNTGTDFDIVSSTSGRIIFSGNSYATSSGVAPHTEISMDDKLIFSDTNSATSPRTAKKIYRMKNASGGTLNAGDVVVSASLAAGDSVTTTTTQGDDKVFGMIYDDSVLNTEYGHVVVEGYTTQLKVDGTTDIAIGDLLGTFTTAKIAMKAAAGDMCFAIALEAYTTDDSNGVIDALLISPRLI